VSRGGAAGWRTSGHCRDNSCIEVGQDWRTSSHSKSTNCAEVASGVLIRDTKDRDGPVLRFPAASWTAFTSSLKAA
jgi:hypothetical protein